MLFLAGNYAKHVAERGGSTAEREETFPYVFMKPPSTTLTHPGDPIVIPKVSPDQIDWECELGVVIGRRCRHVDEDEAMGCIAGYTIINDISDRSFKPNPNRKPRERDKFFDWMHGKWHDTFCPMGPCILSADVVPDPQAIPLKLTVNGQIKQDATTAEMIFPVAGDRVVPVGVRHASAGRRDRHRHAVGSRLGLGHLPPPGRLRAGHHRSDRHPRKPDRGRKTTTTIEPDSIHLPARIRFAYDLVPQVDGRQSRRDRDPHLSLGPRARHPDRGDLFARRPVRHPPLKADEAYEVGKPGEPIRSYLNIEAIVELAKAKDVDAIHPGYGFLSENAEFARACAGAGIAFVGPRPELLDLLGDKVAARKLAREAGIPVLSGSDAPVMPGQEAQAIAESLGYPVIVKASMGGGGRGMRVVESADALDAALDQARREAGTAFGVPDVFIEKFIRKAKHIEVQLLGDRHGNLVHLYERDCSVQRRHQKIVEIAPAHNLDPDSPLGHLRRRGRARPPRAVRERRDRRVPGRYRDRRRSTSSRSIRASRSSTPSPRSSPMSTWSRARS